MGESSAPSLPTTAGCPQRGGRVGTAPSFAKGDVLVDAPGGGRGFSSQMWVNQCCL